LRNLFSLLLKSRNHPRLQYHLLI